LFLEIAHRGCVVGQVANEEEEEEFIKEILQ
jgi:hypothetical protein